MPKQTLSQRQQREIAKRQTQQLERYPEGLVLVSYGRKAEIEKTSGEVISCALRRTLGPIVAGDRVAFSESSPGSGAVEGILPRKTCIYRGETNKLLAANVDQLFITVSAQPAPSDLTVDAYLAAAHFFQLRACLLVNKSDLPETDDLLSSLAYYESLGYPLVQTCSLKADGLESLMPQLQNGCSVFAGQSGVGKSSLIARLLDGHESKPLAGALTAHEQGRHTTTATQLYHLSDGTDLVDSPGVRAFHLPTIISAEALLQGFTEFSDFTQDCAYRNCDHTHEQHCGLHQAVAAGKLPAWRLEHYHQLRSTYVQS